MTHLKPELDMAIAKATGKTRDDLIPGVYPVRATVAIEGTLTVGQDTLAAPTASLLSVDFLALVLHSCGVTRQAAISAIERVAEGYLANWTGSDEDKAAAKAAREAAVAAYDPDGHMATAFAAMRDRLPKIPKRGMVKFAGEVHEVEVAAEAAAEANAIEMVAPAKKRTRKAG